MFDIRESRRVHRVFGVSSKVCPGDIYNLSTDRADIAPAFALCDDGLMMRWTLDHGNPLPPGWSYLPRDEENLAGDLSSTGSNHSGRASTRKTGPLRLIRIRQ